jgi:hypothetical protein
VPKKSVSTSVDPELLARIERIKRVEKRSQAQIVAWAIERGIPLLEREFADKLLPLEILNEPKPARKPKSSSGSVRY